MMKTNRILILSALSGLSLFFACEPAKPKHQENHNKTEESLSSNRVVLFENDYAQAIRVTLNPGEELPPHEGKSRLIYSISDYTIDWAGEGDAPLVRNWKKGDIHVHEEGGLSLKNSGSTQAEWIAFTRKEGALPTTSGQNLEADLTNLNPNPFKQLFDNKQFVVTEVNLAPGKTIPLHDGLPRLVYSLSDYSIRYQGPKEETMEKSFQKGTVHWHDAGPHAIENIGNTEAHFLIVGYK